MRRGLPDAGAVRVRRGLDREVVAQISAAKDEPEWMRAFRLRSLAIFAEKSMPDWGADLGSLDFDSLCYYQMPARAGARSWRDVDPTVVRTFDELGLLQAEQQYLAGVSAQYDSGVVYRNLRPDLAAQGVIFMDLDSALREHPDLVQEYLGTVVRPTDNKFAALNGAVWSGGAFLYVPPGVRVEAPLQGFFHMSAERTGQFARSLIIVDEGASVHFVEGCTAAHISSQTLHSAVTEVIVRRGAHCQVTTIQNLSPQVYHLTTKRAMVHQDATVKWVSGNLGARVSMGYPCAHLVGSGARVEVISVSFAGAQQEHDTGAKVIHQAPHTASTITAKSICKNGGISTYRGLAQVEPGAVGSRVKVSCDGLILDDQSHTNTVPHLEVAEEEVSIEHEATVSRVSEEQLFYLMSRGLPEAEAARLVVQGFADPVARALPMEYALRLNRLIELEMTGSVG